MPRQLHLTVVTPETTLLEEPVDSLRLPLSDGSAGIFPGRAAMVGRLGQGELIVRAAGGERRWFVDGGFVQVADDHVSVLTERATPPERLNPAEAERSLAEAIARPARTEAELDRRELDQHRARRILDVANRAGR